MAIKMPTNLFRLPSVFGVKGHLGYFGILQGNICSQLPSAQTKEFHISSTMSTKKRPDKKKQAKLNRIYREHLKNRLERLDEEDRPTGCVLCPKRVDVEVTYKNVRLLSQFISPHTGKIYNSTVTGLCTAKQQEVWAAVQRARKSGFMSTTMKHLEFHGDPKLF